MGKHLVLAGAGHAHVTILTKLKEITALGHKVTVIGPAARHYYSGMGPGMLGGDYTPEDISFPVKSMAEEAGAMFMQDKVVRADTRTREIILESGRRVDYEVVSFNTGSKVPVDIVKPGAQDVFSVKPIENLLKGRELILKLAKDHPVRVGVVGGGPGALEVAGNAWAAGREKGGKGCSVRVYAGREFLHQAPPSVARIARRVFAKRGIEILEGVYAEKVDTGRVSLADGQSFEDEVIFVAMGVKPRPVFEPSGIPTGDDGGMLANRYLQSPAFPEMFGGGDCIWFQEKPLAKVGVYAVRQNPVLYHNVLAALQGGELMPFDPGGAYLLIYNLGAGRGIYHKSGLVFSGRLAFMIKDYIDRRFIKAFKPRD